MHDNLAQALAILHMRTALAEGMLAAGQIAEAQGCMSELKRATLETHAELREAVFSLRTPPSLEQGFLSGLREYLAEYRTYYGLDARLVVSNDLTLPFTADVQIQIWRVIQEALANVRKHAGACIVWVRIEADGDQILIKVKDNGRGFDTTQVAGEGRRRFGLQVMRERADSVGGTLKVRSRPGEGTQVVIGVPLAPGK